MLVKFGRMLEKSAPIAAATNAATLKPPWYRYLPCSS